MNSDRQERINELFGDAIELPPDQRRALVLAATDDPELRDQVLRMLEREQQLGGFMDTLPVFKEARAASEFDSEPSFFDGQMVAGRYRIKRLIKAGGMGEVYEAFDSKLDQQIALKTILPGIAANSAVIDRFRREVTLARSVTHINVCRVFDFGEHAQRRWRGGNLLFDDGVSFRRDLARQAKTLRQDDSATGPANGSPNGGSTFGRTRGRRCPPGL